MHVGLSTQCMQSTCLNDLADNMQDLVADSASCLLIPLTARLPVLYTLQVAVALCKVSL